MTQRWVARALAGVLVVGFALHEGRAYAGVPTPEQPPIADWMRQLGTTEYDIVGGLASDPAGNAYLIGTTYGALGGRNRGFSDVWIAKWSADGGVVWQKQIGTSTWDDGNGIAIDAPHGAIYVAGQTSAALGGRSRGGPDAWVGKFSTDGTQLWRRQLGTRQSDGAGYVAADAEGNVYVAGYTYGSFSGPHIGFVGGGPTSNFWLAKLSADGDLLWKSQYGSTEGAGTFLSGIAVDSFGSVYAVGTIYAVVGGSHDRWLARYSALDGTLVWFKPLERGASNSVGGLAVDSAGDVLACGSTGASLGAPNQGAQDVWLAKFTPDGAQQWVNQFGSSAGDSCSAIAIDAASGNLFLAGSTGGALGDHAKPQGGADMWIAKASPDGNPLWIRQKGSPVGDVAGAVAVDGFGNALVAGTTAGAFAGPYRGGSADVWIAKFPPAHP